MFKYIKVFLCTLLCITSANADEYSDKVKELLEMGNAVQPTMDMVNSMLESTATQSINQMYQGFKDQGKDINRDDVVELYNNFRREFVQAMGENLISLLIEPYRQSFTLEELDELIMLMKSPAFQKYSLKMPELMAATQQAGELFGAQKSQEIMQRLISENPKFQ